MSAADDSRKRSDQLAAALALLAVKPATTPCIADADMASFVDGTLTEPEHARVLEHLAACTDCYREWRDIRDALQVQTTSDHENRLAAGLALMAVEPQGECLDDELLAAYIDQRLKEDEMEQVERHLAHCTRCYNQWRSVSEALGATRRAQVIDWAAWQRRRAARRAKPAEPATYLPFARLDALKAAAASDTTPGEARVEEYPVYIGSGENRERVGTFSIKPVLDRPEAGLLTLHLEHGEQLPDLEGCTLRVRAGDSGRILLTDVLYEGEIRALVEHIDDFRLSIVLEIEA